MTGALLDVGQAGANDPIDVDVLLDKLGLAGLDFRKIENVVDQPQKMLARGVVILGVFDVFGIEMGPNI